MKKTGNSNLSKVLELYLYLLRKDGNRTTYKEIEASTGIHNGQTIRLYLDLIEEIFNVVIETKCGRYNSGTYVNKNVTYRIVLTLDEENALKEIIMKEDYPSDIRKWCYSILWRLGNQRNIDNNVKEMYKKL